MNSTITGLITHLSALASVIHDEQQEETPSDMLIVGWTAEYRFFAERLVNTLINTHRIKRGMTVFPKLPSLTKGKKQP